MHFTGNRLHNSSADFPNMLLFPNNLVDFVNNGTTEETTSAGGNAYCFHGDLYYSRDNYFCECCGCRMEIHNTYHVQLRHVCIGDHVTFVLLDKHQFICPKCRQTEMQQIPFQAEHHRITVELLAYTENLLSRGYTKFIQKSNELFGVPEIKQPGGNEARYNELLKQNKLLFTADLVREMLSRAFQRDRDTDMANDLDEIIDTCRATRNVHFQWFARLIENHYEGIMAHASLKIASGKIEGINCPAT